MERIFIIGKNEGNIKHFGFPYVIVPSLNNDEEIDRWVISFIKDNQVDKLIIDLSGDSILLLKIALHIRLSLEELEEKALIPLLFISVSSLTNILAESGSWSHILATKCAYFSTFEQVKTEVQYVENLKVEDYRMSFLNVINILPDEKTGRHSLANIWGAYAMDKTAKTNALIGNVDFHKNRTKLYFKFIQAFNYDLSKINPSDSGIIENNLPEKPNCIDASKRKILLIDDEADKGWEMVLRAVFKTSLSDHFVVINEKIKNYDNFSAKSKSLIENTPFDLYLVDLRLNGIEEENTLNVDSFSGMNVLRKIKSFNQGNQVIMFTASNKVWNLKALLDAGADGYYMKESPEFGFSDEFSAQNYARFQEDVNKCFDRKFLFEIFKIHDECKDFIRKNKNKREESYKRFYDRAYSQLEIAFKLLKQSEETKYKNYAYLAYYQILEDYSNRNENFEYDKNVGWFVDNIPIIDENSKEWKLIFCHKSKNREHFHYYKKGKAIVTDKNEYKNISVFPKVSFILAYKFKKENFFLIEWGRLNHLRNTVAAHGGKDKTVTVKDINSLLKIVMLFLTNP